MNKPETKELEPLVFPSDQDSTGRTLGEEELKLLQSVISGGTLTSTKGEYVKRLEVRFAELLGVKHAYACASGTAAIHCAIAALDPEPGDEFVTTSITDMGAITPILYQGAVPVFADVDPLTANVTAETIESVLSDRTRAIIVTHLFGNPAEIGKIKALADKHGLPIIEDCAQAFLATENGTKVGTIGSIGCFSLQQGKHITTGEGGIVVTNDDQLARTMQLFINKAWGYGDPNPDHYFLALNYRMTELQGAVALAQIEKLGWVVEQRQTMASRLNDSLQGLEGLSIPKIADNATHVYWKYCPMVDTDRITDGPVALGAGLKDYDIASAPRYIQKPAFQCAVIKDQKTFGQSRFPFSLARKEALDYRPERFPGTFEALRCILVLPWNECYSNDHVDYLGRVIRLQHELLIQS